VNFNFLLTAFSWKTLKVEIPSNEISTLCTVKRQTNWVVGETVKDKKGKPIFNVLGQTLALASSEQLLLLIRKGSDQADGFEIVPIDYRGTEFGPGKFLFMNAAKLDIAGEIGSEKFVVKPGKHSIIKPKAAGNDDKKLVHATLYFRQDDQPKPFFSSTWPLSDAARCLIFFYHDPDTKHLRLHSIRDFIQ
jgi:hypothetical protein